MKTKNQSSLPSKYWLIIVIVICVILMGVERITGGNGPISFIANYTVIPMQKGGYSTKTEALKAKEFAIAELHSKRFIPIYCCHY